MEFTLEQIKQCLPKRYNRYRRHPITFLNKLILDCIDRECARYQPSVRAAMRAKIAGKIKKGKWVIPEYVMDERSNRTLAKTSSKKATKKAKKKDQKTLQNMWASGHKHYLQLQQNQEYTLSSKKKIDSVCHRFKLNSANRAGLVEIIITDLIAKQNPITDHLFYTVIMRYETSVEYVPEEFPTFIQAKHCVLTHIEEVCKGANNEQ